MAARHLATLLAPVALIACTGRPPASELRVLMRDPVVTLDPHTSDDGPTLAALHNVYDTLVRLEGETGLAPALARSWSNPSDDLWRFELRGDVRFHDGRPLTARDVKYTLERAASHPQSWLRGDLAVVDRVTVLGDHTVAVRTRRPAPTLLARLSLMMVLREGAPFAAPAGAVGTGPYRVESWTPGAPLVLRRAEGYWGGAPAWERAVFAREVDDAARVAALAAGSADVVDNVPESLAGRVRDGARTQLVEHGATKMTLLTLRVQPRPGNPFADPAVREAVALAVDPHQIVREALGGYGHAPTQLVPPGVFGYDAARPEPRAQPAAARAALLRSRSPKGVSALLHYSEPNRAFAQLVADQVRPVGVELTPTALPWSELDARLQALDVDAAVFHMSYPTLDAQAVLEDGFRTRPPAGDRGALNFSGYSDPAMDALLDRIEAELDLRERAALLRTGMERALASHAFVPLAVRARLYGARKDLRWARDPAGHLDLRRMRPR